MLLASAISFRYLLNKASLGEGQKTHVEIIQLMLVVTPDRVVEIVVLRHKSQCLVGIVSYNSD